MNTGQKAKEIVEKFEIFSHGVRVCMLIDRGQMNSNKGSRRWVSKLISADKEQLEANIIKLLSQQEYLANPDIRLYMCVNARNMDKAIKHFQHAQLNLDQEYKYKFYARIQDSFCSSLMKPENRAESLFLIDYDHPEFTWKLSSFGIKEVFRYKTPGGWHIITEPFNPKLFGVDSDTVKKDALLLLNFSESTGAKSVQPSAENGELNA